MAIVNRNTLKNFFKKGGFAKENHFVDLIDSTINSVDDGIQINKNDGLRLNRSSFSSKLISFFKKPNQENPLVSFDMDKDDLGGFSVNGKDGKTILRFDENGTHLMKMCSVSNFRLDVLESLWPSLGVLACSHHIMPCETDALEAQIRAHLHTISQQ